MAASAAAAAYNTMQPADAAPGPIYVDTQHEDLVSDAQMDYYGSKLATCSSGRFGMAKDAALDEARCVCEWNI